MVGGMVSSTVLTLVVIPAIYALWREWELSRAVRRIREPEADCAVPKGAVRSTSTAEPA